MSGHSLEGGTGPEEVEQTAKELVLLDLLLTREEHPLKNVTKSPHVAAGVMCKMVDDAEFCCKLQYNQSDYAEGVATRIPQTKHNLAWPALWHCCCSWLLLPLGWK